MCIRASCYKLNASCREDLELRRLAQLKIFHNSHSAEAFLSEVVGGKDVLFVQDFFKNLSRNISFLDKTLDTRSDPLSYSELLIRNHTAKIFSTSKDFKLYKH